MRVKCVHCGALLYEFVGNECSQIYDRIEANHFSVRGLDFPEPETGQEIICLRCGKNFLYETTHETLVYLENDYWWPHPPKNTINGRKDR